VSQNDQPSFEQDIKPLFREMDREAMESSFDLWDLEDVREHAPAILEAVESGGMPCDSPWPPDRVERFRSWVEAGMRA